jgi:hypothetical protein
VSNIAIFIEGGGTFVREQRHLRVGFEGFFSSLKQLAAQYGKSFRLVACGSRDEAFKAFENERKYDAKTHSFLLVDSEEIATKSVKAHLVDREQHWALTEVAMADLHLMATTMETWIVSDHEALTKFYDQKLKLNKLPVNIDIEKVSKPDVCRDLAAATENCKSGPYHKMNHAPKILGLLNPTTVRHRCSHCDALFKAVQEALPL